MATATFTCSPIWRLPKPRRCALPPEKWTVFQTMGQAALGNTLRRWAGCINFGNYQKHTRGPKKPRPSRPNAQFHHVSTKKLLDQGQLQKKRKQPVVSKA